MKACQLIGTAHIEQQVSKYMMMQSNYFFPLNLKIDSDEKLDFTNTVLHDLIEQFTTSNSDLTHIGSNLAMQFARTIDNVNAVLHPIGLMVYKPTMFMSSGNIIGKNIHCDGMIDHAGNIGMLEARINLYEMSLGQNSIEWWDQLPNTIPVDDGNAPWWKTPRLLKNQASAHPFVICLPPFRRDLRSGKITWDQIPTPNFSIAISSPSAVVRTNLPHHIIQQDGVRVTLSLSIAFQSGELNGVWQHIQNNINQLQ